MDTYIGVDFGGTKLLIGEVDHEGNILNQKRYTTGTTNQEEATNKLLESLNDYMETVTFVGYPQAIGVGIVGVVEEEEGIWLSIDHRVNKEVPLAEMVSKITGLPAFIDNDVKSAAMAELCFGQGKVSKDFIYINIGTGISAGFVINGKVLRGANNNAGEVGHIVVDVHSKKECVCGRKGCVENIASGLGLDSEVKRLRKDYKTILPEPALEEKVLVQDIFSYADLGDELCVMITENMLVQLSEFIMNLVRVTDPDTVIVGGGVVSDGWLLPKIKERMNSSTMRGVTNGLILSNFDVGQVGLIGAAAHAMTRVLKNADGSKS